MAVVDQGLQDIKIGGVNEGSAVGVIGNQRVEVAGDHGPNINADNVIEAKGGRTRAAQKRAGQSVYLFDRVAIVHGKGNQIGHDIADHAIRDEVGGVVA